MRFGDSDHFAARVDACDAGGCGEAGGAFGEDAAAAADVEVVEAWLLLLLARM